VRQEVQVLRWVLANQLTEELTIINRRRGDNQVGFVMLHSFFSGRMLFLTPNQQCRSTEGNTA